MSNSNNETPSRSNNNSDEPPSPADSVVELTECPDCGHLVPFQNMQLHQARACQARKRPARQNHNEEAENRSTTTTNNASPEEDWTQSRLQQLRNRGNRQASDSATAAPSPEMHHDRSQPLSPTITTTQASPAVPAASAPSMDHDLPYAPPDRPTAAAAHPNSASTISRTSQSEGGGLWNSLASCFTGGSQQQQEEQSSSLSTPQSDRKQPAQRPSDSSMQVGDVVDLLNDDDENNDQKWTCPRCTLLNPNDRSTCDACLAPRPHTNTDDNVRPPDAVQHERLVPTPYDNNSASPHAAYMSGGAVVGGLLGATGAYMRGRPLTSGMLEGAMTGAMSGAVLNEVMRDNNNRNMNYNYDNNAARMPPSPQPQPRRRPRRARIVRQQGPNGMTIITSSNGNTVVHQMGGNRMPMVADPMMAVMMQSMLGGGAAGNPSVDGMSYEQLLQAFGDGSENMGADEGQIRSLPTAAIDDPDRLPEDSRACAICLENFCKGETRKTLPCLHGFHESCIDRWLQTNGSCPVCKHRLNQS